MSDNRMSVVHEIEPGDGLTVCCGRSLLELPLTDRATNDTRQRTCTGAHQAPPWQRAETAEWECVCGARTATDADSIRGHVEAIHPDPWRPPSPRVDPSRLPVGGDPSRAVGESPDAAIEATVARIVGFMLGSDLRRTAGDHRRLVEELIAVVRAEAVAGERRRIAAALDAEAHRVAEVPADAIRNEAYWAGRVEGVVSARNLAAGSVPVATPAEEFGAFSDSPRLAAVRAAIEGLPVGTEGQTLTRAFAEGIATVACRALLGPVATRLQPGRVSFGTDAFEAGGSLPGQPVAPPTEPADEWGAPCSCIGDELGNHDPACEDGQRPAGEAVPAERPPTFDELLLDPLARDIHRLPAILNPLNDTPIEIRLCDNAGMVSDQLVDSPGRVFNSPLTYLQLLNSLRGATGLPPVSEPFHCTGSAHLAAQVFRCTSTAHNAPPAGHAEVW